MPAVEPHDSQPHGTAQQVHRQAAQVEYAKYHADGRKHQVRPETSAFDLAWPHQTTSFACHTHHSILSVLGADKTREADKSRPVVAELGLVWGR